MTGPSEGRAFASSQSSSPWAPCPADEKRNKILQVITKNTTDDNKNNNKMSVASTFAKTLAMRQSFSPERPQRYLFTQIFLSSSIHYSSVFFI